MNTIKNLLSIIFSDKINFVWLVFIVVTIVVSFVADEYWQVWSAGSVISVIGYGVVLLILNILTLLNDNTLSRISTNTSKTKGILITYLLIMVALIVFSSVVACLVVLPGIKDDYGIKQNISNWVQLLSLSSVFAFGIIDLTMLKVYEKAESEPSETPENIARYGEEIRESKSFFYYIDVPSIISIVLISAFWFYKLYSSLKSFNLAAIPSMLENSQELKTQIKQLEIFTSGATAFSFLSFNIAFIIIKSGLVRSRRES